MLTRKHKLLIFLVMLMAGSAGAYVYWKKNNTVIQNFVPLKKGTIVESVYGIGTVESKRSYDLRVGIAAVIDKLFVDEGNFVRAGAPLVELAGLRRFNAPFSGTITKLAFKEGETLFPQTSLLTLTDLKNRYVLMSVEQEGIVKVVVGQKVRLSFESLRSKTFEGEVQEIYSSGGRFLVKIEIKDMPESILPGMTADVSITISTHKNVWLAPVSAIKDSTVQIRHKGAQETEELKVTIVLIDGEMAEISSEKLRDGDALLSP